MTEEEWLACEDPMELFGIRSGGDSERKSRLFAVECCRCNSSIRANHDYTCALAVSERFADGLASEDELRAVHRPINERALALRAHRPDEPALRRWAECSAVALATAVPTVNAFEAVWAVDRAADDGSHTRLAALIRDLFGNPFQRLLTDSTLPPVARDPQWRWLWLPQAFVPEWQTDTVIAVAQGIYDDRAFDLMPILADALQDAGCNNNDILNHCRDPRATHFRGCWVVDRVLGRE